MNGTSLPLSAVNMNNFASDLYKKHALLQPCYIHEGQLAPGLAGFKMSNSLHNVIMSCCEVEEMK
jgi:hypothetical protein